jgi:hypothetical protein
MIDRILITNTLSILARILSLQYSKTCTHETLKLDTCNRRCDRPAAAGEFIVFNYEEQHTQQ